VEFADAPGNEKGSAFPIQQKLLDESPAKDPKDLRFHPHFFNSC